MDQRDDNKEAKKTCDGLYREYAATAGYVNTRIHPQDQVRQRPEQQFEGHEADFYRIDSDTGWKYYLLATTTSCSSSSSWWRPSHSWCCMELGLFIMD